MDRFPEFARFSGRQIKSVRFLDPAPFKSDTLLSLVETQPSHCSLLGLPLCVPFTSVGRQVHRFSLDRMSQDLVRLGAFYRQAGYFGTTVTPTVEDEGDDVRVTFAIRRGDAVLLDTLRITGVDTIFDADSLARTLPLQAGEVFNLGLFARSAARIETDLLARGHAYAQVLRNFSVDTVANRATATLDVVPGPAVIVDSIAVYGAEKLGRRNTIRQLSFREGDLLRARRLEVSQRNLYSIDLVQLASVTLAPDSLEGSPRDSSRATVVVRVAEAKVHQVDAAIGYGTVECLRTETQYVNRNLLGAARRLSLSASLSKIGLGGSTNTGIGESLCRAYAADTFANSLDYRLAAEITQPYLMSPRNHLTVSGFVERISEPAVYQRQARGGRVLVTRRLAPRTLLSAGLDVEYGRTIASAVVFCTAFEICVPETVDQLTQPRWRNSLALSVVRDRTNFSLDPTAGSLMSTGVSWAASWLSSDVQFVRWTGDLARYHELRPGWVLAGSVRFGNLFGTASIDSDGDFLPPEERFYAGGANTVRGYARNQLGIGVYVTDSVVTSAITGEVLPAEESPARFVPLGGTAMGIANLELRFPSPIHARRFRMVAFIDAGTIGTGNLWSLDEGQWNFTPGVGLRIQSPVGPARLDLAYNPYRREAGPLYLSDEDTLVRVRDSFRPELGSFWSRFRIHLAIGQAF